MILSQRSWRFYQASWLRRAMVIPLVVILTGVVGVGFMALARDYQWLTIPSVPWFWDTPTTRISKRERAALLDAAKPKENGLI